MKADRLSILEEKQGKDGPVIVMRTEQEYMNQDGAMAVMGKHTYLRY